MVLVVLYIRLTPGVILHGVVWTVVSLNTLPGRFFQNACLLIMLYCGLFSFLHLMCLSEIELCAL
jgi:hypothetical protein